MDEVGAMSHDTFVTLDMLSRQLKELAKSHDLKYSSYMHLLRQAISGLKVSVVCKGPYRNYICTVVCKGPYRNYICRNPVLQS